MLSIPVILQDISILISDVNPKNKENIIGSQKEKKVSIQLFPDRQPIFGFQSTEPHYIAYKDILLAVSQYDDEIKSVRFAFKLNSDEIKKAFSEVQKDIQKSLNVFEEKHKNLYKKNTKTEEEKKSHLSQIKQLEKTYKIPNKKAVLQLEVDLKTLRLVEKVTPKQNNEKKILDNKTNIVTVEDEVKSN